MQESSIDRKRLNLVGNLSIFMIGLGFAVRANIAPNLQAEIYDKINLYWLCANVAIWQRAG